MAPTATQPVISRLWPFKRVFYGWAVMFAAVCSSFALVPTQGPIMSIFQKPIQDELGWSSTTISIGFVLGTFTGGFFSWALGGRVDRHGARGMTVVSGAIVAAAMIGLGLMTQAWHFWALFGAARGFAAAGSQVGTMVALASWFVRHRGRTVGIVGTGQRAGQALLPLPIFAIMVAFSWREAFFFLAGLAVLLAVIPSALFMRRRPEDYGLLPDGAVADDASDTAKSSDEIEEVWTLQEAKRTATLWLLILAQGGVVLSLNAVNLHITANFQERGMSDGLAVTMVAVFAAVSAISMMAWGVLMERIHSRYIGLTVTAMFSLSMAIAYFAHTRELALVFSLVYGLALGGWTVTSRMLFANYFGRRAFGSIRGLAAPLMMIANPLGPVMAGVIKDITGVYDLAFILFGVVFVISFMAFLLALPPKRPVPSVV